jgi:hypothetical protein
MKVLEWILNSVFSIASLWDRSHDELLNEHRAYERRILIYTAMAMILMLVASVLTPPIEIQPTDGIQYAMYVVYRYIAIGAMAIGAFSAIASLSNIVGLIYFRYKQGITD